MSTKKYEGASKKNDERDSEGYPRQRDKSTKVGRGGVHVHQGMRDSANINFIRFLVDDIWEEILQRVEDSQSVHNVFIAYPPFRDTFQNKIPLWLFDQVFPHLLLYFDAKDVRKCSHVCKTWRRLIFRFVDNYPSRWPYNENGRDAMIPTASAIHYPLIPFDAFDVILDSEESMKHFLQVRPNHLNPFIGRSVSIICDEPQQHFDLVQFTTYAARLLEEYGKHIWHFTITCHPDSQLESGTDFFRRLTRCLSLVPNLHSLHVTIAETDAYSATQYDCSTLPHLPHLDSLNLDATSNFGGISLALLRKYANQNLRYLSWPLDSCKRPVMPCLCQTIWKIDFSGITQVKFVKLQDVEPNHFQKIISNFSKDNLQKLEITGSALVEEGTFQKLHHFKIRVLDLERSPYKLNKVDNKMKCGELSGKCKTVSLPSLHTLRIKYHEMCESYKFLADIPSLQTLQIGLHLGHTQNSLNEALLKCYDDEHLKSHAPFYQVDLIRDELNKWIYKREEILDKSLIWNLLPLLQTLILCYSFLQSFADDDGEYYAYKISSKIHTFQRKDFVQQKCKHKSKCIMPSVDFSL